MRLYAERYEEKLELIEKLKEQIVSIEVFVTDHIEEVKNANGGVIGYMLNLNPKELDELMKRIEQ